MASDTPAANLEAAEQAAAAVRRGDPVQALEALTAAVRQRPADVRLRVFLAQLLCVLGQWPRAHTQLNVMAELDASTAPMREMVGHALRCERLRAAVFEGRRTPMVFGEPDAWLAQLIESLLQQAQGQGELAAQLAAQAFDAAPTSAGRIDGQRFEWIADADSRLGPVLEAMVNGRYYWIPFARLGRIVLEPPVDLRDRVWMPAQLRFANGGEVVAMIPVRYPGTQDQDDGALRMAARTDWAEAAPGRWLGLGQRVLVTDAGEYGLLDVRQIDFDADSGAADAADG